MDVRQYLILLKLSVNTSASDVFLYSTLVSYSYQGIDKDDQTKEELQEQPLTNQNPGTSVPAIQTPPTVTGSNQLEEIIILDQNGQALQCERMVRETGLALAMGHRETSLIKQSGSM